MTPRVSVIIPARNAEAYIRESLSSILKQTFSDFELIVIDDGSSDSTSEIVLKLSIDKRVLLIKNPHGGNMSSALNLGISRSSGGYLVRMDADDIALPNRLRTQVDFMDKNPQIVAVGSYVRTFGSSISRTWRFPTAPAGVNAELLFRNPLAHPSVIIRKSAMEKIGGYDTHFQYCQDYALWSRLTCIGQIANIPSVLLKYRRHPSQMGSQYSNELRKNECVRVQNGLFKRLCPDITPKELQVLNNCLLLMLGFDQGTFDQSALIEYRALAKKILTANDCKNIYNPKALLNIVNLVELRLLISMGILTCFQIDNLLNINRGAANKLFLKKLLHISIILQNFQFGKKIIITILDALYYL